MRRDGSFGERYGLVWAVVASIALHAVLFLFARVVPYSTVPVPVEPEETTLRFTFAPTPSDRDVQPRGSIPQPVPSSPPPGAEADSTASLPTPAELPSSAPQDRREPVAEDMPSVLDLPSEGAEPQGETRPPSPRESEPDRRFDMETALRDFRRALVQPRPPAEDSNRGARVTELPQLPATGFGFGNLEFESRDFDWTDYARQIYMAIWRAWHNRLYVTAENFERWGYERRAWDLRHVSRVRFTIEANGEVSGIVLETPSGCYPLDDSATDALREVILPPLPSEFPRSRETVRAAFIAEGDVRSMRSYLGMLKRAGYF